MYYNYSKLFFDVFNVETDVYKCLGHTYKLDESLAHSHYLVMNKTVAASLGFINRGDVIMSHVSSGLIEKVTEVVEMPQTVFIHTEFVRCSKSTTWNTG